MKKECIDENQSREQVQGTSPEPSLARDIPLVVIENLARSTPSVTGKKRFEFFLEDKLLTNGEDEEGEEGGGRGTEGESRRREGGLAFVGSVGQLDCSIGTIFQDDFQKTLEQLREAEGNKNNALSVLIVDDSVIHRKLSQKVLGGMIDEVMWMVECAENGERAMQLVQTSPRRPDVIIIDQNMEPGGGRMLGHEVVELLRKDNAFDHVVIIGCTGMAETARKDLLLAGCDAVWSKPMPSREQAQAQIVQILRNKKNPNLNLNSLDYDLSSYPGFTNQQIYERDASAAATSTSEIKQSLTLLDTTPVFRQVKMARISYKPIPPSSSLLPPSRYGAGGGTDLLPPPNFNFGILPRVPTSPTSQRTIQDEVQPDQNPLDVTSMQRAFANLSTFPSPIVHQFTS
jgi:CheY-like chemotaxis protein